MHRITRNLLAFILVTAAFTSQGQYAFESKKAEKLYNKLEEYYEEADYEKILNSEYDIEEFFVPAQDTLTALMFSFLAEAYYFGMDDTENGLAYAEKEYELRKKLDSNGSENFSNTAFNLGTMYDDAGEYAAAEEVFLELLQTIDKKDTENYSYALRAALIHYTLTGEAEKGLGLLKKNRKAIEKGSYDEAMALKAQGDFQEIQGEFTKSQTAYESALEILEDQGYYPSLEYTNIMNALGLLQINKSKLPDAERTFNDALDMLERMGGDVEESVYGTKFNLAQVYFEYGIYQQAIETYLEILESDKEYYGADSYSVMLTESVLGGVYFAAGDYQNAEEHLDIAKAGLEALGESESYDYARVLNDQMRLYAATDRLDLALSTGDQMLKLYADIFGDKHHSYALALSNYTDIEQRFGRVDAAQDHLEEVTKIRSKALGDNHPMQALSLRKLAIVNWKKDEIEDALEYYNRTFDNYFNQINTFFPVLSEQEKSKFYYNRLRPTFEQYNSFVVEKNTDNKELVAKMYDYQLATKGLILYATNKVRESILNSGDTTLINKYETWISQKEQLAQLFSASELPVETRNIRIDSIKTLANNLEKELSELSTDFANTFASKNITWRDVKAKLKPGEAAVEIIRFRDFNPDSAGVYTDEVYYAALIVTSDTEEAPNMVVMRNGKMMETRFLANYRNAIKYQVSENSSYQLYWRPIANRLRGIKKVYFSPDGVYNQISIYTLRNPATNRYTIDEVQIQLVNNTKDLVAFNGGADDNSGLGNVLFGYPNYNMGAVEEKQKSDEEGAKASAASISQAAAENRGARGGRGQRGERGSKYKGSIPRGLRGNMIRYMRSNNLLALLPGTKREVNKIDSLLASREAASTVFMGNEALEEEIKKVKNPKTLHIATHGFFLENEDGADGKDSYVENPLLRSGLILAGANSYISTGQISQEKAFDEDGILTAYEAMNMRLDDTKVVVLSACETGLGEVKNGEGVFGLQRAFQVAGAESIIMSMWTVDDDATQTLMTNFYEEWLKTGDKQQAFITAQKRLKESRDAPYYWGAFVMVGI